MPGGGGSTDFSCSCWRSPQVATLSLLSCVVSDFRLRLRLLFPCGLSKRNINMAMFGLLYMFLLLFPLLLLLLVIKTRNNELRNNLKMLPIKNLPTNSTCVESFMNRRPKLNMRLITCVTLSVLQSLSPSFSLSLSLSSSLSLSLSLQANCTFYRAMWVFNDQTQANPSSLIANKSKKSLDKLQNFISHICMYVSTRIVGNVLSTKRFYVLHVLQSGSSFLPSWLSFKQATAVEKDRQICEAVWWLQCKQLER